MPSIYMKNEMTGVIKQIEEGFNWKVFLFGWMYLFYKGDIGSGFTIFIFDFAIAIMTTVAVSDYIPYLLFAVLIVHVIVANNWHKEYIKVLEKKDYKIIEA